ncbi:retrotransposon protein, putative, ty1-copia subclass, partial [Tanacetum coccineum]
MFVIEQPIPPAPAADSAANVLADWNAVYDAHNEVACLMLGSMTPELHRQFENYAPYEMLQELKSMFEKQAGMKGYVDQLERLGYVLPQDLTVGLILNGLTKKFAGFVRNYNMHNMGKTIGELHVMLIEYEKGLPKKAETPQVMMNKSDKIQKANNKSLKAKGKGKANGKGKDKQVYIPKPKNPKPTAKEHPSLEKRLSKNHISHLQHRQVEMLLRYGYWIPHVAIILHHIESGLVILNSMRKLFRQQTKFCEDEGIVKHFTMRHTPQQNGVAERMNRTLLEKVWCMLSNVGLGKEFWAEAVTYACHLVN